MNDTSRKGEGNDKVREEENLIGKFKSAGKSDNLRTVYGIARTWNLGQASYLLALV